MLLLLLNGTQQVQSWSQLGFRVAGLHSGGNQSHKETLGSHLVGVADTAHIDVCSMKMTQEPGVVNLAEQHMLQTSSEPSKKILQAMRPERWVAHQICAPPGSVG